MNSKTQVKRGLKSVPSRRSNPFPGETNSPLLFSAPDWEPVLERYRKGDTSVFPLLCCKANPLVKKISGRRYYSDLLGREEAYSIAAMTMVDFWNKEALTCDPADVPRQLARAVNCDLLNEIKRNRNRGLREVHAEAENESQDERQEYIAGSIADPEQDILRKEWNHRVRNCLKYLGKMERHVITGFFFRQMSITEIAEELHSSTNIVSATKRNALNKLREVFTDKRILLRSGKRYKTTASKEERDSHDQTTLSKHL